MPPPDQRPACESQRLAVTSRRAERPSTRARAASTSPRFRRRSAGTTGSSSTRARGRGASRSATCWSPPRASTASRRAACWPTSTATTCRSASSRATPSTPARAAATAPRARPRSTRSPTRTGSCTRFKRAGAAARASGSGSAGTRPSTTSPAGSGGVIQDRHNEVMYHVGRPGEDGFTERVLAAWGVDGPQLPHQRLLLRRPRRLPVLDGHRPAEPRPRQRQGHLPDQRPPRGRALLQPARPADHGRQGGRRQAHRARPALSNTATHADYWLSPWPGSEAAISLAIAKHLIATGRYDREFVRRWWNWHEYLHTATPSAPDLRSVRGERWPSSTLTTRSSSPRPSPGVPAATLAEVAEVVASAPAPVLGALLALGGAPATSAAGRCRGRCSCSTR